MQCTCVRLIDMHARQTSTWGGSERHGDLLTRLLGATDRPLTSHRQLPNPIGIEKVLWGQSHPYTIFVRARGSRNLRWRFAFFCGISCLGGGGLQDRFGGWVSWRYQCCDVEGCLVGHVRSAIFGQTYWQLHSVPMNKDTTIAKFTFWPIPWFGLILLKEKNLFLHRGHISVGVFWSRELWNPHLGEFQL